MDESTLNKLQFDHIREVLAGLCCCALGAKLARSIQPGSSGHQVRRGLAQVDEMNRVHPDHGFPSLGSMRDILAHVERSAHVPGLDAEALSEVQQTLAVTGELCHWLDKLPDDAPLLRDLRTRTHDLTPVADEIDRVIDSRASVRDDASPKLASLRADILEHKNQLVGIVERILKQTRITKLLQYPGSTFHDDRIVLPLKSEHQGRIPGIIHRSSDTGATLFIEPAEAVELNNAIIKLKVREQEEIGRILSGLSRRVHQDADHITETLSAVAVLDLIVAKTRYAQKYQAICPEINDRHVLDLHGARHPVLISLFENERRQGIHNRTVVPIDLRIGDDADLLVITGPNTGGKTVAIKTVGLLAAMIQSGIPIPVDPGTTLPIFNDIFMDIGDEQSLEQSLSTFSAHLSRQLAVLERAEGQSLVLIDELGAGTDPEEGAAIGRAIMEELLRIGCCAIVTTHLAQLKAVAYTTPRVDNASVEFDIQTLKPTYVVRMGEPGNSNAITIAERLGMPPQLCSLARSHLDQQHHALTRAIEGTLETRRRAEEARKTAANAQIEAQKAREEFEQKAKSLDDERAAYRRWARWINHLKPGDPVHVQSFGRGAKVVRTLFHQQKVIVTNGTVEMEVPLNVLQPPDDEKSDDHSPAK